MCLVHLLSPQRGHTSGEWVSGKSEEEQTARYPAVMSKLCTFSSLRSRNDRVLSVRVFCSVKNTFD